MALFTGFSPETLHFFQGIIFNNTKSWLAENRESYEQYLLNPFRALVSDLAPTMHDIDPLLDTSPSVGRTIARIYRDVRFSRDKSPLRANLWITFKRRGGDSDSIPSFYFDLRPEAFSWGMGFYAAKPLFMQEFRKKVMVQPDLFRQTTQRALKSFTLGGADYARPPVKEAPADLIPWLGKKSFYLYQNQDISDLVFSEKLTTLLSDGYRELASLYQFLMELVN